MKAAPALAVLGASLAALAGPAGSLGAPMSTGVDASRSPYTMSFHSVSFHPPRVTVSSDPDTSSGDIFLAAKHLGSSLHFQRGPMILDSRGRLVWFKPVNGKITNLEVQHLNGRPVLTWWESLGKGARAFDVILNRSYHTVAVLHAGDGYRADSHEFQITSQGTALIDAVKSVRANLTSVGGPSNGTVSDCLILELNIKTGRIIWKWNALDHIPLTASYAPYRAGQRYDAVHLNSLQQLPNGNIVMSGRNTWAIYEIDRRTGRIIWTLGGKHSSFSMGSGTSFAWQHDAHMYPGGRLSLFDDATNGFSPQSSQSSGEILHLNFGSRTATLVHRYYHSPPLIASSQGSTQILPNGNVFVGWGDQPDFSEYRPDGQQIFNGAFPYGAQSYRAYRFPWSGRPTTKPSLALDPQPGGSVNVYASWNGATDVAAWRVFGGPTPRAMVGLGTRARTGFETEMKPASEPAYFEIQALDSHGHVLGTSAPHADPAHVAVFGSSAFVESSTGVGGVGVGCFTRQTCHLSLRISSGGTVLARSIHPVARGTGRSMEFKLSHTGLSELGRAPGRRLSVTVTLDDSASKTTATRRMTLIPYSTSGRSPVRGATGSGHLELVQDAGFVSTKDGTGEILAACYGSLPCQITGARVSAGSKTIGHGGTQRVGLDELSMVHFKLTSAGLAMLKHARGNQLGGEIVLSDKEERVGGRIDLVGYR